MTIAVIVAAYRARQEWLAACLASIQASAAGCPDVDLDIRIGVDGCAETAAALDAMGLAYHWSAENVGPYVLRNSLLQLAPADAYVIFDADDVMLPGYMSAIVRKLKGYALVGPSRQECDEALSPVKVASYRHGVCAFRHAVLERLGGYKAERVSADVDFIARARTALIHPHITTEACYLRRRHDSSLTKASDTGFGSPLREQARKRMERARLSAGQRVYVAPVTVPLEYRARRRAEEFAACVSCGVELTTGGAPCWVCRSALQGAPR